MSMKRNVGEFLEAVEREMGKWIAKDRGHTHGKGVDGNKESYLERKEDTAPSDMPHH
jgi:hypothetical protein